MAKYKLEYIWLDGYQPLANLRSKTQIKDFASSPKLEDLPLWGFDGSSTKQAEGKSSDCVLRPVACFPDSTRKNGVLVMEAFEKLVREDGRTIVMVTHEQSFAHRASRQIMMSDGRIVADVDQRNPIR